MPSFAQQIGEVQADTTTKFGQVATQLNGTQTDLSATKADLEATKGKLQSTIGDLGVQSGLIARNHDEVEELKRLGERDIFEFSLNEVEESRARRARSRCSCARSIRSTTGTR